MYGLEHMNLGLGEEEDLEGEFSNFLESPSSVPGKVSPIRRDGNSNPGRVMERERDRPVQEKRDRPPNGQPLKRREESFDGRPQGRKPNTGFGKERIEQVEQFKSEPRKEKEVQGDKPKSDSKPELFSKKWLKNSPLHNDIPERFRVFSYIYIGFSQAITWSLALKSPALGLVMGVLNPVLIIAVAVILIVVGSIFEDFNHFVRWGCYLIVAFAALYPLFVIVKGF